MMNKFLAKLVVPLVVGLFLSACNSTSSGGNAPDNPQVPANSGGQSSASGSGEISVQLPTSPEVPPANVIQQISFVAAGGGDRPNCDLNNGNNCINANQDTILLTYFQPNQQLRVDIYYSMGKDQDGTLRLEFLTELEVQTDNNGTVEIHTDRDCSLFKFIVWF